MYERFLHTFWALPLASVVEDRVFVTHGGLSDEKNVVRSTLSKVVVRDDTAAALLLLLLLLCAACRSRGAARHAHVVVYCCVRRVHSWAWCVASASKTSRLALAVTRGCRASTASSNALCGVTRATT